MQVNDPSSVNDTLLATQPGPPPSDWRPLGSEKLYPSIVADYYELSGWTAPK